ncbi:L,D-transpeptidase family protein [Fibrella forsythiae]|uniref:L,D-transpeptidase family protein n=1 Tax=Fibrella forsythiae TaxID=2817061 RepID=A0ABS3JP72_9BACT|nr:L,D-transpeptidase family protein [Fibrella forsythiae]MBO0951801.1 L,D-transpeptidase family protein [Fibrella forsythiae]
MRRFWLFLPTYLAFFTATAQTPDNWNRIRQYASAIGVDSLATPLSAARLTRYFTEIVYGRTPRRMGFQNVPEQIDTARINRLTIQFMTGADWCPLLDSLESHDRRYRQLKAYCMQCLTDDYMADSLTIEQVKETLNTYRWLNRFSMDKCVVVNLPAATLQLVDRQGTVLLSSRAIVGKPDTPTPSFTALIASMVLYPYWNVPRSIMTRELLPKIRKNPAAMLDAMKMQVMNTGGQVVDPGQIDWTAPIASFPYRLRQSTGCDNALGLLKFNVNNPYDIYLHDTNARRLFAKENRALSHGCVRVEKPAELANLLLGQTRFSPSYLTSCPKNATPKTLTLRHPVPVIMLYNILDIDEEGAIRVYRDIYGWWRMAL